VGGTLSFNADDGDSTQLKGATDLTLIGNTGDRLRVDGLISPVPSTTIIYFDTRLYNGSSELMNVNGSVTPVNFDFTPASGETWYLDSITLFLQDNGVTSPTSFGAITELTNGLEFRVKSNGTEYLISSCKNNMHLSLHFKEDQFVPGTTGLFETADIFTGRANFKNPIILKNSTSDFVRMRVRDNLSGLDQLRTVVRLWRVI
jgi:hypothetical protein